MQANIYLFLIIINHNLKINDDDDDNGGDDGGNKTVNLTIHSLKLSVSQTCLTKPKTW